MGGKMTQTMYSYMNRRKKKIFFWLIEKNPSITLSFFSVMCGKIFHRSQQLPNLRIYPQMTYIYVNKLTLMLINFNLIG
jgi:hypothetical protein